MFRDYFRSLIWFEVDSRISDEGIVCVFEVRRVIRREIVSIGYSVANFGDRETGFEGIRRYRDTLEKSLKHSNSVIELFEN